MVFLASYWLWILPAAVLAVAGLAWLVWANYTAVTFAYCDKRFVRPHGKMITPGRFWFAAGAATLSVAWLCVALARPAVRDDNVEFPQGTVDVVVLADVSRSMAVEDYPGKTGIFAGGTRLDMVRHLLLTSVLPACNSNSVGMVSFAGQAFDQAHLSTDTKALAWLVEHAMLISSAPGHGSNLWDAFNTAFSMFEKDSPPGHKRVILLFSDGGCDNEPAQLAKVVELCRKHRVTVMVVGLGTPEKKAISVDKLGEQERKLYEGTGHKYLREAGENVLSAREEEFLVALAGGLGGTYTRLDKPEDFVFTPGDFELEVVRKTAYKEVFRLPLLCGFLALACAMVALRPPELPGARRNSKGDTP